MDVSAANMAQVAQLLAAAAGNDDGARKQAQAALSDLDETPGFVSNLLELSAQATANPHLRLLALITVKNTVDRGWSRNISTRGGDSIQQKRQVRLDSCGCRLGAQCHFRKAPVAVLGPGATIPARAAAVFVALGRFKNVQAVCGDHISCGSLRLAQILA